MALLDSVFASRFYSLLDFKFIFPCTFSPPCLTLLPSFDASVLTREVALTRAVGLGGVFGGEVPKMGAGEAALAACTCCRMPKVASKQSVVEMHCLQSPA